MITVLQVTTTSTGASSLTSDSLLVVVQIVQVAITFGLVYYAWATIREAKNDRKKASIERMLEKIYFPMLNILDTGRNSKTDMRGTVREWGVHVRGSEEPKEKWAFVLTQQEFDQIREMVERFGYYLESTELDRLRCDLEGFQLSSTYSMGNAPWVRLSTDVFDSHWRYFKARCSVLTTELQSLTGMTTSGHC